MGDEYQPLPEVTAEQAWQDEQQDYNEFTEEQREEAQFGGYPGQRAKESIFTFFKHVLGMKDSTKVANLDPRKELGMLDLSVRNCEYLSQLGYLLHEQSFEDFFNMKAQITLATSMSKKGWFPELIVSQRRFTERRVQPVVQPQPSRGFLGIGGKKPQQQNE